MKLIDDKIDLSAYIRSDADAAFKVRPASEFSEQLRAAFKPREKSERSAEMFSTKLRSVIEFRPGEVTCWAGYSGHRKSMFVGQVALDLIAQRQRSLLASFEMQPSRSLARMARQAVGLAVPMNWQLDKFDRWTNDHLWLFDHFGRISPERCLAVCRYFAEELRGHHAFIDSMMMVCASEEHLDEQKQFMTDAVRLAQETGLHVHVVAHCRKPASGEEKPPTKYDLRGSAAISDQAHNVVMVWSDKAKKGAINAGARQGSDNDKPDALVTIEKQRNGAWEGRVRLWFDESSLRFTDSHLTPIEPYAGLGCER
jgi:twinkle protein